ncbi:MAG TPA: alpha/beta hydrolase [Turneriella sp.]|nr:alpha/beta hydrolase [Turneriella sp.]HNL55745.1 alpha/beta hydrolase [Turneriella sp.]HNN01724.1 alpha/beta hydrolase [Turneriella sp.]
MKKKLLIALALFVGFPTVLLLSQLRFDIPVPDVEARYKLKESKFMEIGGMRVHYTDEGKGEVVLLVHGTAASLHTWQNWVDVLKKDFRVIRMDLPAFGITGPAPDRNYSIDSYVKFLRQFLAELKIKQVSIAGNSLGGQIAWHYTAAYPDDVNKMILIDSAGLPRLKGIPMPIRLARMPVISSLALYISPRFLVRNSLKEVYFDSSKVTEELVDRYQTMALREGNRQAFVDRANQLEEDSGKGLERIKTPTLILWGRHDRWIPVEQAENFRKKMPWSQVIIYDNAGHIPHEEIPEQTLADTVKFLK